MTHKEELKIREQTFHEYVGQCVKRFYCPFESKHIHKIKDHRVTDVGGEFESHEFLYSNGKQEWWADCEDSCVITNEIPIRDIPWVANVNDPEYKGYDPFTKTLLD